MRCKLEEKETNAFKISDMWRLRNQKPPAILIHELSVNTKLVICTKSLCLFLTVYNERAYE